MRLPAPVRACVPASPTFIGLSRLIAIAVLGTRFLSGTLMSFPTILTALRTTRLHRGHARGQAPIKFEEWRYHSLPLWQLALLKPTLSRVFLGRLRSAITGTEGTNGDEGPNGLRNDL